MFKHLLLVLAFASGLEAANRDTIIRYIPPPAAGGGGGAPTNAQYWTGAADGTLSAEKNLGALGTGLVINTTGTPSIFAGGSCTNQFFRSVNASGAPTCATVSLTADITGTLAAANGGLGITTTTDDNVAVGSGAAWVSKALPDCDDSGGNHLNYDTGTNAFSCGTSSGASSLGSNTIGDTLVGTGSTNYAWYGPSRVLRCEDEALNYAATTSCALTQNSGTGTSCQVDTGYVSTGDFHPGTGSCDSGSTATGSISRVIGYTTANVKFAATNTWIGDGIVILDDLSDGSETYTFTLGFWNGANTDGCYVTYTHGTNSGKFLLVSESGASQSTADSGVTVAADTWYDIRVIVDGVTSCAYYINGSSVGSLNTNIPTSQIWGFVANMTKSVGTTLRQFGYDYLGLRVIFGSAR